MCFFSLRNLLKQKHHFYNIPSKAIGLNYIDGLLNPKCNLAGQKYDPIMWEIYRCCYCPLKIHHVTFWESKEEKCLKNLIINGQESLGQNSNPRNNLIYCHYVFILTRLWTLYTEVLLQFPSIGSQHNEIILSTDILIQGMICQTADKIDQSQSKSSGI